MAVVALELIAVIYASMLSFISAIIVQVIYCCETMADETYQASFIFPLLLKKKKM